MSASNDDARLRPIVVLGPTAGGKSELAVRLAEYYGGQVISADSMQVYRYMEVGTAKPSSSQRARAIHHLVDIIDPTERFTMSDWVERAEALITELQAKKIRPVVVGGTNLYMKGLLEGVFQGPDHDPQLRERLDKMSSQELRTRLEEVDQEAAMRIHQHDRRKMVRAIEVYELTGQPISSLQTQWQTEDKLKTGIMGDEGGRRQYRHHPVMVGLDWPAELINPRINWRVKAMFYPEKVEARLLEELNITQSLMQEVESLAQRGLLGFQARQALGYQQVLSALAGEMTLEEAYEKTKILTRRFAKTQRTWLRRYHGVKWLQAAADSPQEMFCQAIDFINNCQ